ncbi:MAG: methyltransferase domain-containing protein, partial [Myxococcales bacterium]|nr:methyltransferase domain-containing protein [Myxococcales bacterium]
MNPWRFRADWLELSDLVLDIDPTTLERRPVDVGHVHDVLTAQGNPWGARILASLPTDGRGSYAPAAVDALLVRCHLELQRLALELQQGARTRDRLRGLLPWVRERVEGPIRIVDVGCGIGYVLRWLAAWGELGSDVELIGCDFNLALLEEARRLARADGLS